APPMKARSPAPRSTTARSVSSAPSRSTASIKPVITGVFSVFSLAALSMVTTATPRPSRWTLTPGMPPSSIASHILPSHNGGQTATTGNMAIAPLQPHKSWYRHFWYAQRSPRDTLLDRTLIFAIVVLSLVAAGLVWIPRDAARHPPGQTPTAEAAR